MTPTLNHMAGQVIIVTGAAGDLGWGIANLCLETGANVAMVDVDEAALAARGNTENPHLMRLTCDISNADQTRAVVDAVLSHWGRLDVLVNNAAVVTPGEKVGDLSQAHWEQALAVNLTGAWLMSKWALVPMRSAGQGVILNIASQLGSVAAPGRGA